MNQWHGIKRGIKRNYAYHQRKLLHTMRYRRKRRGQPMLLWLIFILMFVFLGHQILGTLPDKKPTEKQKEERVLEEKRKGVFFHEILPFYIVFFEEKEEQ